MPLATGAKPILVTGASGLIGRTVARRLVAAGRDVVGTDLVSPEQAPDVPFVAADVRDMLRHLATLLQGCDGVIHCGGVSGPMLGRDNPAAVIDINVSATSGLLDLARMLNLRRVVSCSSVAVYGQTDPEVTRVTEATPMRVWDIYGASKIAADAVLQAYVRQYDVSAVALRIGWVYGPGRRTETILSAMIRAALAGVPWEQAEGADQHLQFVHVSDVADGLIAAFDAPRLPQPAYNLVGDTRVTVATLADMIRDILPAAAIHVGPGKLRGEATQAEISAAAAKADLGWVPQVSLARGIADYVDWLRLNPF